VTNGTEPTAEPSTLHPTQPWSASETPITGRVALVGAGPGDSDLLTVRAAQLIAEADVVVHDALVGEGVLALVPPTAELIDVGKRPGRGVPQELTNTLLISLATQGRSVVRLKGGDPFVFGRGGEEAQVLSAAGVPVEIVPGVTSAIAAPAAAGIPITYRGVSAALTVVTGHRQAGAPVVDWRSLARVGGTIVVLMGVAERARIATELMAGGLPGSTPVAAIMQATVADEHVVRCSLDTLADTDVRSPATLVIGAVAALDVTAAPTLVSSLQTQPTK
jgi:uroporphyrin-III C-methyltransferase